MMIRIYQEFWGLPAGSLKAVETFEEAVIRAGKEKLGVDLEVGNLINEGEIERENFLLHMKEFEAKISLGEPQVPQILKGITQYQKWKWGKPENCIPAAQKGSLCSRLLLGSLGKSWN